MKNPGHSAPNKILQLRVHLSHGAGPKLQAALGMALAAEAECNRFVKFVGVHRRVCGCWDEAFARRFFTLARTLLQRVSLF